MHFGYLLQRGMTWPTSTNCRHSQKHADFWLLLIQRTCFFSRLGISCLLWPLSSVFWWCLRLNPGPSKPPCPVSSAFVWPFSYAILPVTLDTWGYGHEYRFKSLWLALWVYEPLSEAKDPLLIWDGKAAWKQFRSKGLSHSPEKILQREK